MVTDGRAARTTWQNHPEEFMQKRFITIVAGCAVALTCLAIAAAQTQAQDRIVVDSPTYTFIPMEIDVDRPAAVVWARVGGYCDIGEWFGIGCTMTSGVEGEFGSVRSWARPSFLIPTRRRPEKAGRTISTTELSRRDPSRRPHRSWSTPCSTTTRCWPTPPPGKRTGREGSHRSRGHSKT